MSRSYPAEGEESFLHAFSADKLSMRTAWQANLDKDEREIDGAETATVPLLF